MLFQECLDGWLSTASIDHAGEFLKGIVILPRPARVFGRLKILAIDNVRYFSHFQKRQFSD